MSSALAQAARPDADAIRAALACGQPRCTCASGRVGHCPAHPDSSPSFAVDDRGGIVLVRCYAGCQQHEVIAALRRRGLWPTVAPQPRPVWRREVSPAEDARRCALAEVRHQPWNRSGVTDLYRVADAIRGGLRLADLGRRYATSLGDCDRAWNVLEWAAQCEREALAVEAELDEILAEGRV